MHTPEHSLVNRLSRLVALNSISSPDPNWDTSNHDVIECLANFAEHDGWSVQIQNLQDQPGGKANLVASLGKATAEEQEPSGLVLAGHTDTVPFDETGWDRNPLALEDRENRFYGLGSTDMKGFFAIALEAASAFDPKDFRAPLYLLGTADEESTMQGARALMREHLPSAKAAVIGEPTNLQPIRLHKGIMMQSVQLRGKSGHSSNPDLGNNVIDALPMLVNILSKYRQELANKYRCELMAVPTPTMNFGCCHGGDSPNRICGELAFNFDVRMLPGLEYKDVESALNQRLVEIADTHGISVEMHRLIEPIPAFEQPAEDQLVRACESVSGTPAGAVNFATEAPFLQSLGLETIVMGPGSIDVAHQPNEYLPAEQIEPAIAILQKLIARYCL